MLRLVAPLPEVLALIEGLDLVLACNNGHNEIVIAGTEGELAQVSARARRSRIETTRLPVSHAFHSPMIVPAVAPFAVALRASALHPPALPVFSTVTGDMLEAGCDLTELLLRQITAPVQFGPALTRLGAETDLLIEVGPGTGLTRLAREAGYRAVSVDAFANTLQPFLTALGAAFVHGQPVNLAPLFSDRSVRSIDLDAGPTFLSNPCGRRARATAPPTAAPIAEPQVAQETVVDQGCDVLTLVRRVIAEETGFAPEFIRDHDRFLDDLHLNSIAVARMVNKAARLAGLRRIPDAPTEFANGCAYDLAAGLLALRDLTPGLDRCDERIPGIRPWVRPFVVYWTAAAPPCRLRSAAWRSVVVGSGGDRAKTGLPQDAADADSLLVWIDDSVDAQAVPLIFAACRDAWADPSIRHLAICHSGAAVGAFTRSIAAERRFHSVIVLERPPSGDVLDLIWGHLNAEYDGLREIRLDAHGQGFAPQIELASVNYSAAPLHGGDVILVTGGAKGIGAECALRLASSSGAALILVGRSASDDPVVAATLARAATERIRCRYAVADVADSIGLADAVTAAAREFGPITALIHAAGINEPLRFPEIDDQQVARAMTPKLLGFRAALDAAGPALRRVVTFGSIIGRIGLAGEAHYAMANAWQTALAEQLARTKPQLNVLCLEWSVWNGAGMGHRLGSIERLAQQGVDAIPLDQGIDIFERLVQRGAVGTLIVTSRFGPPPDVALAPAELALGRFLDRELLHYPGVELVIETTLNHGRDLFLDDHRIDHLALLPGVIGLEAMAQVAAALVGRRAPVAIETIAFRQAVVVPDGDSTRIRILALAGEDGRVEAAIRAEDDDFATDRLRATFDFDGGEVSVYEPALPERTSELIDAGPLYGSLLFQGERFQAIKGFSRLTARRIAATLLPPRAQPWFGPFEPQQLVLGNPGVRDALLHALQVAVPHLRVVPVSVERIVFRPGGSPVTIEAEEIAADVETFVFDIKAYDATGAMVEHWHGASFRGIKSIPLDATVAAVPQLAAPYVERVARASNEEPSIEVALVAGRLRDGRRRSALAALQLEGRVFTRQDGKPIVSGGDTDLHVSIAHCADFTLAVKARREIACDIERSSAEPPGADASPGSASAIRLWTRDEVALKHNQRPHAPCTTHPSTSREDVVTFENAFGRTTTIHIGGLGDGLVVAIGTPNSSHCLSFRPGAQ